MKYPGGHYSSVLVLVLVLLVAALPRGRARPNGSPLCPAGAAAVGGLHLAASSITTGTVADGGFRLRIGRTRVDHGGTVERPAGDTDLILDVASFKGIFVRIEGTAVMHKVVNTFFFPLDLVDTLFNLATKAPVPYEVSSLFVISDIDDELKADGRTIFAFQDSAYSLLPSKFRSRLENDSERMKAFLLDHVIIGVYPRELLTNGLKVNTVSNKKHEITIEGDGMFRVWSIDDIELKTEDGVAANGLVHMMDSVLLLPVHEEAVGLSTFEECQNNLYLSDLNRDDKITEAEFLVFINRWSDIDIEDVLAEVLEALSIVRAAYGLLEETVDEGINVLGVEPGVTMSPEQEASLRVVCAVTADAIHEALSLPPPPDGPLCCPEDFTGLLPFAA